MISMVDHAMKNASMAWYKTDDSMVREFTENKLPIFEERIQHSQGFFTRCG
jgi:hypothetical protein